MAKGTPIDTITAGFLSAAKLNSNFASLISDFDNTISRDGSTPNTMLVDFDMNGNDILNVGTLNAVDVVVNGTSIEAQILAAAASATTSANEAAASAASAAESAASAAIVAGLTEFTGLTDTPASYSTHGNKFLKVNAGATAVEFVAGSGSEPSDGNKGNITVSASGLTWNINAAVVGPSILKVDGVETANIKDANVTFAKIAGAATTGADLLLVSGTAGTTNFTSKWDANGDLIDGFEVLDEDNLVSDSDTKIATQQSIKAYVDSQVSALTDPTNVTATTSGTSHDVTSIAAGTNVIDIIFHQVSTDGIAELQVQIGDAGGIETSGYVSDASDGGGTDSSTIGFICTRNISAGSSISGVCTLTRHDGNIWIQGSNCSKNSVTAAGAGRKTLSAELDRIRITNSLGDTFDAGAFSVRIR